MHDEHLIIVAGGSGKRMQMALPKQFIRIHGKPILVHTINRFYRYNPSINVILVIPENHQDAWEEIRSEFFADKDIRIALGGKTRFHSVANGLALCPSNGIVGIHDAVRPLVTEQTIENSYSSARDHGSGIPVVEPSQSLRKLDGDGSHAIDRSQIRVVQTPQCFQLELIKEAFEQDHDPMFTDDASVLESYGLGVYLVEGNDENFKITKHVDLKIAELLLS